jgi:hypothetical protein
MMFTQCGIGLPRCEVSRHRGMRRVHRREVYRQSKVAGSIHGGDAVLTFD